MGIALFVGCADKIGSGDKVPVELFIASKCERAADLISTLKPMILQMNDRIDLKIDYIGNEKDGELYSLLGDAEVKGDILELCAREIGGADAQLHFVHCMSRNRHKIPENFGVCEKAAGIDAAKMKSCSGGEQGRKLLRDSFKAAAANRATRSPVIVIAKKAYNGLLTEPSLGRALCDAITQDKPKYCSQIPVPIKVRVTVVNDKRCRDRSCDTKRLPAFIARTLEGAEIRTLDYSETEGKAAFEKTKRTYLPVILFSSEIKKDKKGYERLRGYLYPVEGSEDLVYPVGVVWDPGKEICDDGADNNGDGAADCKDESCKIKKECRAEIKNKLTLFSMSQCSFSVRAEEAVEEVLENFGNNRKKVDFSIEYVGKEVNGELLSMHGQSETDEALRRVCTEQHYRQSNKFMEYILCRDRMFLERKGKETAKTDWVACAEKDIRADVIRKCAEGEEGKMLLFASFRRAADLGITGAPRWIVNDKFEVVASSADDIKRRLCARNEGLKECANPLSTKATITDYCGGRPKEYGSETFTPSQLIFGMDR